MRTVLCGDSERHQATADELPAERPIKAKRGLPRAPKRKAERSANQEWHVGDDWPERIPITDATLRIFEAHFADLLDRICGED